MTDLRERSRELAEYYRRAIEGHVFIRETLDTLLTTLDQRIRALGRAPRILELGCHGGLTTEMLVKRFPEARFIVHDDDNDLIAVARDRLAGSRVAFHTMPLRQLAEPVDIVVSVAKHHHLPHDYLAAVRRVMAPEAIYVVADELCPEYCRGDHAARIERAEVLHIAGGYVLTTRADAAAFVANGSLPASAVELEDQRRRALWHWYRFVVDRAVDEGYFDIAAGELQSARDDLVTGSDAEHKFSPLIVERQFALAGFRRVSKRLIGPSDRPERQSLFVYEFAVE